MSIQDDPFADMVKYDGACQICHGDMRKCDGKCGGMLPNLDELLKRARGAMQVRAKFQCVSVKKYASNTWDAQGQNMKSGFLYSYEFQAVTGGSDENKSFFASTPTGNLSMSAVRDDLFVPGQLYYLDFTPEVEAQ